MKVTIQLTPDMEADLIARAQGLDLVQDVEQVLREEIALRMSSAAAPAELAEAWRGSARGLPYSPPLSDEAISRKTSMASR